MAVSRLFVFTLCSLFIFRPLSLTKKNRIFASYMRSWLLALFLNSISAAFNAH